MFIRLFFITFLIALAAVGTPLRRDEHQVELDIQDMAQRSRELTDAVDAFPDSGGNYYQLFVIHESATNLVKSLEDGTKDATISAPFTDAQTDSIIRLMAQGIPVIQKGVHDIKVKKPGVAALGGVNFAKNDLEDLKTNAEELGTALAAKSSVDKRDKLQEVIGAIVDTLGAAIAAYSS